MKRFPLRELLLVIAPVAVIGLGMWGAQLREQRWPTRPRISCTVNPATPFELWQGADVDVTTIAIIPSSIPQSNLYAMKYSLVGAKQDLPQHKASHDLSTSIGSTKGYRQLEENHAYRLSELASSHKPLIAEVSLFPITNESATIKQRFELSTKDIAPPDITAAQRSNFRPTKARLMFTSIPRPSPTPAWRLTVNIEDVEPQVASSPTSAKFKCIKLWMSQNNNKQPIPLLSSSATLTDHIPFQFDVEMNLSACKHPFPKGTKIGCLVTIAGGWPQIIEADWPDYPAVDGSQKELNFSTKLALPNSKH